MELLGIDNKKKKIRDDTLHPFFENPLEALVCEPRKTLPMAKSVGNSPSYSCQFTHIFLYHLQSVFVEK